MPNPWNVGTARVLVELGFQALATTSSGLAWSEGRRDNAVPLERVLEHFRAMADGVAVPINADFEGGFAEDPGGVLRHVAAAAETGVAGLSIEDATGRHADPLFDFDLSVDRVRAAREAIDRARTGVLLTARSEGFIVGRPDLSETIRRLTAFAEAGADCLYAPGLSRLEDIRSVVRAVAPKPVNVLVGRSFASVVQLADAGVRRISVGGALARTAWAATMAAASEIAEHGTFTSFDRAVTFAEINGRFES